MIRKYLTKTSHAYRPLSRFSNLAFQIGTDAHFFHQAGPPLPARTFAADFRVGLFTNVLNPKVAFFFLAFLPQFVPAGSPHKTLSFLLLGAWFVVQGFLFLMLLVVLAARLAKLGASGRVRQVLNALGGVLFIALALRLLRERPVAV